MSMYIPSFAIIHAKESNRDHLKSADVLAGVYVYSSDCFSSLGDLQVLIPTVRIPGGKLPKMPFSRRLETPRGTGMYPVKQTIRLSLIIHTEGASQPQRFRSRIPS